MTQLLDNFIKELLKSDLDSLAETTSLCDVVDEITEERCGDMLLIYGLNPDKTFVVTMAEDYIVVCESERFGSLLRIKRNKENNSISLDYPTNAVITSDMIAMYRALLKLVEKVTNLRRS